MNLQNNWKFMLLPIHTKERNNFHGTEKLTFRWQIKNQEQKRFVKENKET